MVRDLFNFASIVDADGLVLQHQGFSSNKSARVSSCIGVRTVCGMLWMEQSSDT